MTTEIDIDEDVPRPRGVAYLLRGLPGSGKSTLAAILLRGGGCCCSTDDYFLGGDGVYRFAPQFLAQAHAENQQKFAMACAAGIPVVVCDNTNLLRSHLQPYLDSAKAMGYIIIEVVVGRPRDLEHQQECSRRNVHGLTLLQIQKMARKFEP